MKKACQHKNFLIFYSQYSLFETTLVWWEQLGKLTRAQENAVSCFSLKDATNSFAQLKYFFVSVSFKRPMTIFIFPKLLRRHLVATGILKALFIVPMLTTVSCKGKIKANVLRPRTVVLFSFARSCMRTSGSGTGISGTFKRYLEASQNILLYLFVLRMKVAHAIDILSGSARMATLLLIGNEVTFVLWSTS